MPQEDRREEQLLDLHLDRLSDEERSWVEEELQRDADLREKSQRLGNLLRPLDHWSVAPAPLHLTEQVLRSLQTPRKQLVERALSTGEGYRPRRVVPFRELAAAAACLGVLAGVAVPGVSVMRDHARQTICAGNLASIFQGTSAYQASFGGSLPFAGYVPGSSWLAETCGSAEQPVVSNSRHLFLLAKHRYVPNPEQFVCPASKTAHPMTVDRVAASDDFASPRNISYDSLNMASARPNLRPRTAMAYVSDANPLFIGGRFHESVDPVTNSPAHGGRAQSVLTLDGAVARLKTPIYGSQRDNLWLAGDIRRYTGTETATSEDDAFLVPGCPRPDGHSPN